MEKTSNYKNILAVDLGGSYLKWAVINTENKNIIKTGKIKSQQGANNITKLLIDLIQYYQLPLALAIAGDVHNNIVQSSEHLQLENYDINKEFLKNNYSRPLIIVNDATAACAGQLSKEYDTLAYLSVGTGIGGKIAINNKVITGFTGAASEIGHIQYKDKKDLCECGLKGCCELYGGWKGISNQLKLHNLDIKSPLELINSQNQIAKTIYNQALDVIAYSATHLIISTEPPILFLGGGVVYAWEETIVKEIKDRINKLSYIGKNIDIKISQERENAAFIGLVNNLN